MPGIFISYRREDSAGHAGRIFDRLRSRFGSDFVFMDVAGIEAGVDFVDVLHKAVGSCDALLAVIGPHWLSATHDGKRRLDDPHDFVRIEIAGALERNVRVLPVLVEGAAIPSADSLPADLQGLARRQTIELRDARWDDDIERLLEGLEKFLRSSAPRMAPGDVPGVRRTSTGTGDGTATGTGTGTGGLPVRRPTGRGLVIAAVAALVLVFAAVLAWRGGLLAGSRSSAIADVSQQTAGTTPLTQPPVAPAADAGRGSSVEAPRPRPASVAAPDVTGKTILDAREALRSAGFRFLIRLHTDPSRPPGVIETQALDDATRRVDLTAVATSTLLIHIAKGGEETAEGVAAYLKDRPSTIGTIVRIQTVAPRPEIAGRVAYSEPRLAAQADAIAKDVSDYAARSGNPGRLESAVVNRVAGRTIIVGLDRGR